MTRKTEPRSMNRLGPRNSSPQAARLISVLMTASLSIHSLAPVVAAQCGLPEAGDCCTANGTPGCQDAPCCDAVCSGDPFCCVTTWDAICADLAAALCPGCPAGEPPMNDNCDDAIVIPQGETTFSTLYTTTDGPEHPGCKTTECGGDVYIHNDVWFEHTALSSGFLSVSTCGPADFNTRIAIYEGCGCGEALGFMRSCNDEGSYCTGGGAEVVVDAVEGACYKIRIGSTAGQVGQATVTIGQPIGECPGTGPCDEPNGTPGCTDIECCSEICGYDPFCCHFEWDATCAEAAWWDCYSKVTDCCCDFFAEGDCCIDNGTGTCEHPACCHKVCEFDQSCCSDWDGACADAARHYCPDVCPQLESPCGSGAGDCCLQNGSPGCEDGDCCQAVCALDPLCCSAAWDGVCAQLAASECGCGPGPVGCGQLDAGPCCTSNGSPFCADAECCETICATQPSCCELEWDLSCANLAMGLCSEVPEDIPTALVITARPMDDCGGDVVTSLGFPTVNGLGQPAVNGEFNDGEDHFLWVNGEVLWRSSEYVPIEFEQVQNRVGVGNEGSWALVTRANLIDYLVVNGDVLIAEGDPSPPPSHILTAIKETAMLDDGTVTWLGSYSHASQTKQAVYKDLNFVFGSSFFNYDGYVIGANSIHLAHDFSGDGEHYIFEAAVQNNFGTEFVVVDDDVVAVEGEPNGWFGLWQSFKDVGVNDQGDYVFSGTTLSNPAYGPFVAINGVIVHHQGVSGVPHVAINDYGYVVSMTSSLGDFGPRLRFIKRTACNEYDVYDLLDEFDEVRIPVGCSAVAVVRDFKITQFEQPILEFAEDGYVYIHASLETEGTQIVDALVRVAIPRGPNPPDINGDCAVDALDLVLLLASWGFCPICPADLDGDDAVGAADLAMLLANWG